MNKEKFLSAIEARLNGLPLGDTKKALDYYSELIEDRMEEGMSENEAVASLGNPDEVANQILMDMPLQKLVGKKVKQRRSLGVLATVLLIISSPMWVPLVLAALIVDRGDDQILEHLDVVGIDGLGLDLDGEQLLLAVDLRRGHAAAGAGLELAGLDLLLHLLHLLLKLLRLARELLHVAAAHHIRKTALCRDSTSFLFILPRLCAGVLLLPLYMIFSGA